MDIEKPLKDEYRVCFKFLFKQHPGLGREAGLPWLPTPPFRCGLVTRATCDMEQAVIGVPLSALHLPAQLDLPHSCSPEHQTGSPSPGDQLTHHDGPTTKAANTAVLNLGPHKESGVKIAVIEFGLFHSSSPANQRFIYHCCCFSSHKSMTVYTFFKSNQKCPQNAPILTSTERQKRKLSPCSH